MRAFLALSFLATLTAAEEKVLRVAVVAMRRPAMRIALEEYIMVTEKAQLEKACTKVCGSENILVGACIFKYSDTNKMYLPVAQGKGFRLAINRPRTSYVLVTYVTSVLNVQLHGKNLLHKFVYSTYVCTSSTS